MSEKTAEAPPLSPDFAARVLRQADRAVARRRTVRFAGASALVVLLALVAGSLTLRMSTAPEIAPQSQVARLDSDQDFAPVSAQSDQTDTLGYMFSDAAPLAAFQERYADASASDGVENAVSPPGQAGDDDSAP